jgi:hypothetical protein
VYKNEYRSWKVEYLQEHNIRLNDEDIQQQPLILEENNENIELDPEFLNALLRSNEGNINPENIQNDPINNLLQRIFALDRIQRNLNERRGEEIINMLNVVTYDINILRKYKI